MERIQSAINKARAARKELSDVLPAAPSLGAAPSITGTVLPGREEIWASLPEFKPNARHLERHRGVSFSGGAMAAPFDSMRTRLLPMLAEQGWRRIAITSPGPGCGKTTVCLNLAFSLARLTDQRVIVIECDLRRPSMARALGIDRACQISAVLAGESAPEEHLLRIGSNLAVGTNQSVVRNSAELMQAPSASAALAEIEKRYQPTVVLFDMPPMLVSDDTMAALGLMDCALLVAAAGTTTITEIDRSEQELARRTNVVGVVLNKCRYLDKTESYSYGYY